MNLTTAPLAVTQKLARAKSLLKRGEALRALESLISGIEDFEPSKLLAAPRFEVQVLIEECVAELNRIPLIQNFLASLSGKGTRVNYTLGQEKKLKQTLSILHKALHKSEVEKRKDKEQEREERKNSLREKGLAFLQAGELPKARATLRVLGDEFGDEPGMLAHIGEWLLEAKMYFEAAEFLEQSMEAFPKESRAYAAATSCYIAVREFEKAETVYLNAIKQFGKHPKTMLNLAKLYVSWNKKDKAFEAARTVLGADPANEEAQAIAEKCS